MPSASFLLGSAMTALEGLAYLTVGWLLMARTAAPENAASLRLFRVWWFSIGTNKLVAVIAGLGGAYGVIGAPAYLAALHVNFPILALSLGSLMGYLLFLLRGRTFGVAVGVAYALYYLVLEYNFVAASPTGFAVGAWRTYHVSAGASPPLTGALVLAGLVLPQVVASVALMLHVPRAADRDVRYRLVLVASSILLWTASVLFVAWPTFDTSPGLQVASRVVGLVGASSALSAYRPPAWVSHRLHHGDSARHSSA